MSIKCTCKDFTEGFFKLNKAVFFGHHYDFIKSGVTAHNFDVTLISETADCSLNLTDLNYSNNKWKMLNNLYFDAEEFGVFLARILHYKNKVRDPKYVPDIAFQFKNRRNVSGACLLSLSLGKHRGLWHCNVQSRASEITCRWPMDLIFIHVMVKTMAEFLDIPFEDIRIRWHMISTYQSITSMPLFVVMAGEESWFDKVRDHSEELPVWQLATLRRFDKAYLTGEYSNYKVQRRPIEAYQILKGIIAQSKDGLPTGQLQLGVIPFKGTFEDDYEDTDLQYLDNDMLLELVDDATNNDKWGKGGYR